MIFIYIQFLLFVFYFSVRILVKLGRQANFIHGFVQNFDRTCESQLLVGLKFCYFIDGKRVILVFSLYIRLIFEKMANSS